MMAQLLVCSSNSCVPLSTLALAHHRCQIGAGNGDGDAELYSNNGHVPLNTLLLGMSRCQNDGLVLVKDSASA